MPCLVVKASLSLVSMRLLFQIFALVRDYAADFVEASNA